jgi:hypothetical protein
VGDGVNQDFHLAKRYFDQAAEVDAKARVPRDIALALLEVNWQPYDILVRLICFTRRPHLARLLQGHKTFNALFGQQALSQLLNAPVLLPASWSELKFRTFTVWELLQYGARLEGHLRRQIDALVLWYCEHVLQPSREVAHAFGSPLSVSFQLAGRGGAGGSTSGQHRITSVQDYLRSALLARDSLRGLYDRAFDLAYRVLFYMIRGKRIPPLNAQQSNYVEVVLLREELLLVVILAIVFCLVLALRVLRRRWLVAGRVRGANGA